MNESKPKRGMTDNTQSDVVAWMWQESWPDAAGGENIIFTKVALEKPDPQMLYVLPGTITALRSDRDAVVEECARVADGHADMADKAFVEATSRAMKDCHAGSAKASRHIAQAIRSMKGNV